MAIVTGDRYLDSLVKFIENNADLLIEGSIVLKLNPVGLRYVQSRLEALAELESLISGAPVDYLRAYVSDLGDHRALEQLRRILCLLTSLKIVSALPPPARDPTPLSLLPFSRLKVLELRGCDLSTSAARGLLELRHTLEKLICHNSTDALRHVFASRIAAIKDSPQWRRLSFVSCACNGLVLMDESLQLLPAVETLDLSRNKFAKVDNLRKLTKLKHLDLGFNHLRNIASFREVSCQIIKLVLRNNALTALRGIENLKSLQGLDLSCNIISSFSEVEILAGLPSLQNLWLEGNPICSARWYRAQVFSLFLFPGKLKLDEKKISTSELWKRQIIIASRQKRPASFGFYFPATSDAKLTRSSYAKRKKLCRVVSIESEDQSTYACSDQGSVSCDNEIPSKEGIDISDEEAEIVDLMNRIEIMKKERSEQWLEEFKEWVNQASNGHVDGKRKVAILNTDRHDQLERNTEDKYHGETSRYISDSVQASGGESSTFLESDYSFADASVSFTSQGYSDRVGEASSKHFVGYTDGHSIPIIRGMTQNQDNFRSLQSESPRYSNRSFAVVGGDEMSTKNIITPLTSITDVVESQSLSASPSSPPYYRQDILQRRQNLEEEFLQRSAESLSVASSDSDTSYSEDDFAEFGQFIPEVDLSVTEKLSERTQYGCLPASLSDKYSPIKLNGTYTLELHAESSFSDQEDKKSSIFSHPCASNYDSGACNGETVHVKEEDDWLEKKKHKRKPKRRMVSIAEVNTVVDEMDRLDKSNGVGDIHKNDGVEGKMQIRDISGLPRSIAETSSRRDDTTLSNKSGGIFDESESPHSRTDNFIEEYFNYNFSETEGRENCREYICCNLLFQDKSGCRESEVAVLLSSGGKFYVLTIVSSYDGSGTELQLLGCHKIADVRKIYIGLGLQILWLCFEREVSYLLTTRNIEKSRQILCMLDVVHLCETEDNVLLKSLEKVQVDLFERDVCGGSNMSIFQYSMVIFWHNDLEDNLWLSRSLFVLKRHLLVCMEDLTQFPSLPENATCPSYFSLDLCCSIIGISEMVIESRENNCTTLALEGSSLDFCPTGRGKMGTAKPAYGRMIWKIKWPSEESMSKFVALLKAIHAEVARSPLVVQRK